MLKMKMTVWEAGRWSRSRAVEIEIGVIFGPDATNILDH
jgi:hypothetical protein